LATPQPQLPRWALIVIGLLGAAVLVLGGAWWQSARVPAEPAAASAPLIERRIELPQPAPTSQPSTTSQAVPPARPLSRPADPAPSASSLAAAATSNADDEASRASTAPRAEAPALAARETNLRADAPALPSATALAAEGIAVPALKLELHAFSERPAERFVFINGRKYVEGERLREGPDLVSIEPTGAVLAYSGRRFVLVQE
jgi:general secretion pathway protein B